MSKIFLQESSEAFLKLKSLRCAEQKKLHQRVSTECIEKHFEEKDMVLFGFSKKKLLGTLLHLLNKPMGFITKLLEKQFKDSP